MKQLLKKIENKGKSVKNRIWSVMQDRAGENYVDVGVKILIAVVIGALLLAGLYALIIYAVTSSLGGWYLVKLYTIGATMVTLLTVLGKLESIKQF